MNVLFRQRLVRAARYGAYAALAIAAFAVAAVFVIPAFLDIPAVEREIQAKLSQSVHGKIGWEKLSIRLLPSPRGVLSQVRVEIPEAASLRAERLDVRLRLLPLLRGHAEAASISLLKPEIRIEVAQPSAAKAKEVPLDLVEVYRSTVDEIRGFAPGAMLEVEDGDVDVRIPSIPPIRVSALDLQAHTGSRGLELELTAASDSWGRLKVSAEVDFADLSATGKLEVAGLKAQPWLDRFLAGSPVGVALPAANLRAQARTDGKANLECDFDLRAASVEILRAGARVQIPEVAIEGKLAASGREIAVRLSRAQLGASRLGPGSLRYLPQENSLAARAEFDLDLAQAIDSARRMVPEKEVKALHGFQPVAGRARGQAKLNLGRSDWSAEVEIRESDSSIGIEGLPGPVKLASGTVKITRDAVKIGRADVSLLDARAIASATVRYRGPLRVEGDVSEGSIGKNVLAWAWKRADAPPRLALKAPLRVVVEHAAWSAKQPLELKASAWFDAGPGVAVDLNWTPEALDIRRAAIKDAKSDAILSLHLEKALLQGRFSGSLQSASMAAMLASATVPSGAWNGDLRVRFDLKQPERFAATGKLRGKSVDLAWLLARPVTIERVDLEADGDKLHIREAAVDWAGQHFALSGELSRAADGAPVVDAQLESPGVSVDALLKRSGEAQAAEEKSERPADEPLWTQWPLPVRGRIALRSGFIQYGERRAEPVAATLVLEERRAALQLQEVKLCGISLPMTVEARPEGLVVAVRIVARGQQLEHTARCLTERGLLITGEFDLTADLRTRGRPRELLPNLEGTISAESRQGSVMKFAVLGNILAMTNVASLLEKGGPRLDDAGFPYRRFGASGRFGKGRFILDESSFRSDAVGLAANGWISLTEPQSRLSVLVAPFDRLTGLLRELPIVGYIFGGTLTSVPVSVSGDIRNPLVVPLGVTAVTTELLGVFERTLKTPARLLQQPGTSVLPEPGSAP